MEESCSTVAVGTHSCRYDHACPVLILPPLCSLHTLSGLSCLGNGSLFLGQHQGGSGCFSASWGLSKVLFPLSDPDWTKILTDEQLPIKKTGVPDQTAPTHLMITCLWFNIHYEMAVRQNIHYLSWTQWSVLSCSYIYFRKKGWNICKARWLQLVKSFDQFNEIVIVMLVVKGFLMISL